MESSRTYAIIFGKYDEFMAGLTEFAENNKLKASHFTARSSRKTDLRDEIVAENTFAPYQSCNSHEE